MIDLKEMEGKIITLITDLDEESVIELATEALEAGMDPLHLLELISEGMSKVGKLYEEKEYFIADLIMAGVIFKDILALEQMQIHYQKIYASKVGKVIVGTVKGDIHDIGKDILKGTLEANGFDVLDLGADVPAETFVAKFEEYQPDIIGLSGILTSTIDPMKKTVDAFVDSGIRDKVKIILGGGHLTEAACNYIGADNFASDVSIGVRICKDWMLSKNRKVVSDHDE